MLYNRESFKQEVLYEIVTIDVNCYDIVQRFSWM